MKLLLICALLLVAASAPAQTTITNSGGTATLQNGVFSIQSATTSVSGNYTLSCPVILHASTYEYDYICNTGVLAAADSSTANLSGVLKLTVSGGGRLSPRIYSYIFTGTFPGGATTERFTIRNANGPLQGTTPLNYPGVVVIQ
jgi:hypothetical protein